VREKKSRNGRNPQTGETMVLDGRRVVVFKASGVLKGRIGVENRQIKFHVIKENQGVMGQNSRKYLAVYF